jgi:hypothetical protein
MKRQPILAVLSFFYFLSMPHTVFADTFGDSLGSFFIAPVGGISIDMQTPKERSGSQKIITGAKLIAGTPFAPITGAVLYTQFMTSAKQDCMLSDTLLYGTSGALMGTAAAPASPIAGTIDISMGASQLPIEIIQHFSELEKQDIPEPPQAGNNQPTATVAIMRNGTVRSWEIPLEINSKNLQLKQKLVTSLDE